jgi:hypothetical protein
MDTEVWPNRVIGGVALLVFLAFWSPNGFATDYRIDEAAASHTTSSRSETSTSSSQPSGLSEAIRQNTPGNSEGQPLGLSWDKGFHRVQPTPPSGFSAVTGWGQVYQEAGASVSPNAATGTVQIENFTTYVHLTNGSWVEVQSQAQDGIGGAHYRADFSGNANIPWSQQTLSDGSVSVDAPPSGYNDHFWPGARGTFAAGTVDGVFVEADMKTNDPSANLVASIGADWWQSATSGLPASGYNPGVGQNNWVKLTTNWQTLYFSSLSPEQLTTDPPVHLLGTPRRSRWPYGEVDGEQQSSP